MTLSRFGALDSRHRGRLAEILVGTAVFTDEEITLALGLLDETVEGSYEFVGAFDADDVVLAYACYGPTPGTDGTFDIYWIAVDPSAQGAGRGTRLLGEVERRLCERGGRLVIVETSSRGEYESTRRFYHARGYQESARIAAFYGPADDRVIYVKRLTPKATSADRPPSTH